MAQVEIQSASTDVVSKTALPRRRFLTRFVISSVSSTAGLISFVLSGPVMCRVAAIDPALEALYLALVFGWFWSLTRMWSLTFALRNRQ